MASLARFESFSIPLAERILTKRGIAQKYKQDQTSIWLVYVTWRLLIYNNTNYIYTIHIHIGVAYVSWHCVLFSDGPFFATKDALGFDLTISDGEVVATVPDSWRRLGNERIDTRPTLQANSLLLRLFAENRLNDHKCVFKCISVLGHLQLYYKSIQKPCMSVGHECLWHWTFAVSFGST